MIIYNIKNKTIIILLNFEHVYTIILLTIYNKFLTIGYTGITYKSFVPPPKAYKSWSSTNKSRVTKIDINGPFTVLTVLVFISTRPYINGS